MMNSEAEDRSSPLELDTDYIKRLLPHRHPFLLIDRLTDIHPGVSAVAWKTVSIDEPHFAGHFPSHPVMPGVLIVEAMAQAAGALVVHTLGLVDQLRVVYFMTINRARFRRPVYPGTILRIPVKVQRHRGPVWRFEGEAYVGDELCAEAEYSAMLTEQTLSSVSAAPSGKA